MPRWPISCDAETHWRLYRKRERVERSRENGQPWAQLGSAGPESSRGLATVTEQAQRQSNPRAEAKREFWATGWQVRKASDGKIKVKGSRLKDRQWPGSQGLSNWGHLETTPMAYQPEQESREPNHPAEQNLSLIKYLPQTKTYTNWACDREEGYKLYGHTHTQKNRQVPPILLCWWQIWESDLTFLSLSGIFG